MVQLTNCHKVVVVVLKATFKECFMEKLIIVQRNINNVLSCNVTDLFSMNSSTLNSLCTVHSLLQSGFAKGLFNRIRRLILRYDKQNLLRNSLKYEIFSTGNLNILSKFLEVYFILQLSLKRRSKIIRKFFEGGGGRIYRY